MLRAWAILVLMVGLYAPVKFANSMTDQERDEVYKLANEFSICGGNYYAASEIMKKAGMKNIADNLESHGNGRHMAAAWLLFSTGTIDNWQNAIHYAAGPALNEKTRLLAIIESASNLESDMQSILSTIKGKCTAIDGYQAQLVEELRRYMYEHGTQASK